MKKLNFLFFIDDNFSMPLAVSIKSIIENNKDIDLNFYVIDNGIKNENKDRLKKTAEPYKIVFVTGYDIHDYIKANIHRHMITPAYSRLLIDKYIPEDENECIIMDADTLCLDSLKDFADYDFGDTIISGVNSIAVSEKHRTLHKMAYDEPYINIGFMNVDLKKWRNEKIFDKMCDVSKNYPIKMLLEEMDLINIVLMGRKKVVPPKYNIGKNNLIKPSFQKYFFDGDSPYGSYKFYTEQEIKDSKNNVVIYHYGGYSFDSPLHPIRKSSFQKEFDYYKSLTAYKDIPTIMPRDVTSKKELFIYTLKYFIVNHFPYPISKAVYNFVHKKRSKNSVGTTGLLE